MKIIFGRKIFFFLILYFRSKDPVMKPIKRLIEIPKQKIPQKQLLEDIKIFDESIHNNIFTNIIDINNLDNLVKKI